MFRPGAGELLIIVVILAIIYVRYRAEKAGLETRLVRYARHLAPKSRGGQGAWRTMVAGIAIGSLLCAVVVYVLWRFVLAHP